MEIPIQRWKNAIESRQSTRTYKNKIVPQEIVESLKEFIAYVNNRVEGVRAVFVVDGGRKVVQTIIGSYGIIKGVRSYIAFIADEDDERFPEKLGYLGEMCVLEATSLGLDTCWISGTFKPGVVERQIKIEEGEKVVAITPVGYGKEKKSIIEKIMKKMVSSRERKSLEELCPEGYQENWPEWIKTSLELARIAPSAVNKQPWRFIISDDEKRIKIYPDSAEKLERKRLDCGIAMLHIEIGARSCGIEGQWNYMKSPGIAVYSIE
ncbi:MAG: nitroreductase family protein [Halanaerobiaceae bacterium]